MNNEPVPSQNPQSDVPEAMPTLNQVVSRPAAPPQPEQAGQLQAAPYAAPAEAPATEQPQPQLAEAYPAPEAAAPEFTWHASEYVQHHKSIVWYLSVIGSVIVLSLASVLITKSWLSIALFVVMGIAIMVYAQRPPRTLVYALSSVGMTIDGRLYPYANFRSFSVLRDEGWHTIDMEPTQRFMPRLTVLFDDEDLESIVSHLLQHLPRVDREPDWIEKVTRYLRF